MAKDDKVEKTAQEIALDAKLAELDAKMSAMLDLEDRLKAQASGSGGINAAQLEQMLTRVTSAAAEPSNILARKLKPENADHLHISPFEHPDGGIDHPKPALARDLVFMGRVRIEELTYAEVIAVNALNASLARSQRRVCRDGKWVAKVSDDNMTLTISVPTKSIDDRADLPSLLQIVQELTSGERALDAADLAAELVLLKAKFAEFASSHA